MTSKRSSDSEQRVRRLFQEHGGILRTSEAIHIGISSRQPYRLRDRGFIEFISRGLYRLADLPPLTNLRDPDQPAAPCRLGFLCAHFGGFTLHAATRILARERSRL